MTGAWNKKKNLSPDRIFFLCVMLIGSLFTLSLPSLKFTIFIHLPQKFRIVRKTRDTFAEFPEFYVIFASSLIGKRDKQEKVIDRRYRFQQYTFRGRS